MAMAARRKPAPNESVSDTEPTEHTPSAPLKAPDPPRPPAASFAASCGGVWAVLWCLTAVVLLTTTTLASLNSRNFREGLRAGTASSHRGVTGDASHRPVDHARFLESEAGEFSLQRFWGGCVYLPCFEHSLMRYNGKMTIAGRPVSTKDPAPSAVSWLEFERTLDQFLNISRVQLSDGSQWHNQDIAPGLFEPGFWTEPWAPSPVLFLQKLLVHPGSVVVFFGDLHGSVHSLLRALGSLIDAGMLSDSLEVRGEWKRYIHIVFLGDYVDRGLYGVEVVYLLMRLKLASPDNVHMARGNHEDRRVNQASGSFETELINKFSLSETALNKVFRLYEVLPAAIFLGSLSVASDSHIHQFIQCCHGGLEVGFDPHNFLQNNNGLNRSHVQFVSITELMRKRWLERAGNTSVKVPPHLHAHFQDTPASEMPVSPSQPNPPLGYLWSDFVVSDPAVTLEYSRGRGFIFGKKLTRHITAAAGVVAVMRAHQHNNNRLAGPCLEKLQMSGGCVDHWKSGLVFTFLSASGTPGLHFNHDSYGVMHVGGADIRTWQLHHCSRKLSRPTTTESSIMGGGEHFICDQSREFRCNATKFGAGSYGRLDKRAVPWLQLVTSAQEVEVGGLRQFQTRASLTLTASLDPLFSQPHPVVLCPELPALTGPLECKPAPEPGFEVVWETMLPTSGDGLVEVEVRGQLGQVLGRNMQPFKVRR